MNEGKALAMVLIFLGPGGFNFAVAQAGAAGDWPSRYEQSAEPRRYSPWSGQRPEERHDSADGSRYRGPHGQRTWSNYSRAGEDRWEEFGRPEEQTRHAGVGQYAPDRRAAPETAFPGCGTSAGCAGPGAYGSGFGSVGPRAYTPLPYGPVYGSGSPWAWGW